MGREWVSVKERMPENHELVLIYTADNCYGLASHINGEGWLMPELWDIDSELVNEHGFVPDDDTDYICIVAWMELPKPYKEDE